LELLLKTMLTGWLRVVVAQGWQIERGETVMAIAEPPERVAR
jgi:hypothetical protein